jgi:hypothetical protein
MMVSLGTAAQVAHETEVKAQIMLRFNAATGQRITVVRAFQVCSPPTRL